jgi:hypothetical protein
MTLGVDRVPKNAKGVGMATWLRTVILGMAITATVAVGMASAAFLVNFSPLFPKGDLLAAPIGGSYQTVETRGTGGSILSRGHSD